MSEIREWKLEIGVDDVLRGQGSDPAVIRARRPTLLGMAEWALKEGLPLLEPLVWVEELAVDSVTHERVKLAGGGALSGPLIVQHLAGARNIVVMLCTIGHQLETMASQVMQTDPLLGLALDGLGNAAVEALAGQACVYFEEQAKSQGLYASIPLSPGMVGWSVDPGQRQVFNLFEATRIGVSLNDSLMMTPAKSLTQALGFSSEPAYQGRTCDFCSLKETCRYQEHYRRGEVYD